jgi:hypothetical protein
VWVVKRRIGAFLFPQTGARALDTDNVEKVPRGLMGWAVSQAGY